MMNTDIFVIKNIPPAKITSRRIQSHIVHSPISSRLNFAIGSSVEIMAQQYSEDVTAVLVKETNVVNARIDGEGVGDEVKLSTDTSSCFILYPNLRNSPGQVLGCEVSTYEVDASGQETNLVLQTIADREFINVCKLIAGYSKTLKIYTASVPCTPKDSGFDVELDSLTTKIYCRSRCIKNKELWSPGADYVPGKTIWNGGPCQMVCRKGDYEKIQKISYRFISEIEEGVYLFELADKSAMLDIIWNTLPVEKKIVRGWSYPDLLIQPTSFVFVEATMWEKVFPNMKSVSYEHDHFASKNKRTMSLATYYLNDAMDARNKLIQARIQNIELGRGKELIIDEYKTMMDIANSTIEQLSSMLTNLKNRYDNSSREATEDEPARKRSRETSDNGADDQTDDDQTDRLVIVELDDESRQPESLPAETSAEHVDGETGERRSFPTETFFKPNPKIVRFSDV